jgi:hypothetical protein
MLASSTPALPADACSCRVDSNGKRIARACPTPWDHPAGTTRIPAPLTVSAKGALSATLRGVNWFGWENGQHNVDGLWAYCDDNATSCVQDGEVPPSTYPSAAIGAAGQNLMQLYFWKRRMTNDFAAVVWRLRLLGFNAVRLSFVFSALEDDLKDYSEFYACAVSQGFGRNGAGTRSCFNFVICQTVAADCRCRCCCCWWSCHLLTLRPSLLRRSPTERPR